MKTWIGRCLLFLVVPAVAFAMLGSVFGHARENARRSSCQSELKKIGLGMKQYLQDSDGKFSLVSCSDHPTNDPPYTVPFGWADAIQPYLKSTCIYQCPSETTTPDSQPTDKKFVDYWFNANLANHQVSEIASRSIVLNGDGISSNARYALTAPMTENLVPTSYGSEQSSWHHLGGANFSFADGHVKWLKPGQVTAKAGDPFTFSIH